MLLWGAAPVWGLSWWWWGPAPDIVSVLTDWLGAVAFLHRYSHLRFLLECRPTYVNLYCSHQSWVLAECLYILFIVGWHLFQNLTTNHQYYYTISDKAHYYKILTWWRTACERWSWLKAFDAGDFYRDGLTESITLVSPQATRRPPHEPCVIQRLIRLSTYHHHICNHTLRTTCKQWSRIKAFDARDFYRDGLTESITLESLQATRRPPNELMHVQRLIRLSTYYQDICTYKTQTSTWVTELLL